MYAKVLLALVALLCFAAFIPVYVNVLMVPGHLLLHALLILGLLKMPGLRLSLSANQFAACTSILPIVVWVGFAGIAIVQEPSPAGTTDLLEILLMTGYTVVVCALEFLGARFQFKRWRLTNPA